MGPLESLYLTLPADSGAGRESATSLVSPLEMSIYVPFAERHDEPPCAPKIGRPLGPPSLLDRRGAYEQVVGDQSDGQVHDHEDPDRFGGLALVEYVEVG